MKGKKLKRLFNLIAVLIITASALVCGCKFAPASESFEEPEIKQEATLPELPEESGPSLSSPEPVTPPANSQAPSGSSSTRAEVPAEFEFTPINDTECSVTCTNNGEATYAEIPEKVNIGLREYTVTEIAEGAFCYLEEGGGSRLGTVFLPFTIKKIGLGAFQRCYQLTEVKGLSYVEEIGDVAFAQCRSLKQADLSSALTIGDQTFIDCESLESVNLYKVISIGPDAFMKCTKLSEIVIPQSVETMSYWVFGYSNTLVKIAKGTNTEKWREDWNEINENQNVIWDYEVPAEFGFTPINETECSVSCKNSLTAVTANIPETAIIYGRVYTVTDIDGFAGCENLEYVHLPDSVTSIMHYAFAQCINLAEINLNNVKAIYNSAFFNCKALTEIIIPDTVEKIQKQTFNGCNTQIKAVSQSKPEGWDDDWNFYNENQNVIWGWFEGKAVLEFTPISETECSVTCTNIYSDEVTFAEVPEKAIIDGKEYTVTELGIDCFYYGTKIEKVVLPDTITSVKEMAFCYCPLITEISLPNAIYIRQAAFSLCSSLTNISLPKALCIEYCAFDGCESLQSVEIPSVQWIESYAFSDCFSLKEIVLPKSLTTVWGGVFDGNNTQVRVVKGTNTDNWDENWNKGNANQDVDYFYLLPAKFEFKPINDTECYVYCTNEEEAMQADIPATAIIDGKEYFVTDINHIFENCTTLEKVTLPYTVTKIGDRAFYGCENLYEISTVFVTEIGDYAFAFCSSVDELIISGVTKIGQYAFRGCENLTRVEISNVTEIGTCVFMGCTNLLSAELNNVSKIRSGAFYVCASLSEVKLSGVTEIGTCAFRDTALKDIVIPATVEVMGARVFENCDTQVKAVAEKAPEGWNSRWNANNQNQNVIWGWFEGKAVFGYTPIEGTANCAVYCLNKEEVTYAEIPSTAIIGGKVYTVTKIADNAFSESSKLQTVILPYTITEMGNNAFADCTKLEEIFISAKVVIMGENVFNGCTTHILVYADQKPDGWADNWNGDDTNIEWGHKDEAARFIYKVISETECEVSLINRLTAVEAYIPAKYVIDGKEYAVTAIADGGFKESALLKKIVVPYTLKYIGAYAFANCPELESFSLYNVQTIGEGAFENCTKLERLFIPKSVTFVGNNILSGTATAVFARASSDEGWAENWNAGNGGEVEFDSKFILPVEIPEENEEESF